MAGTGLPRLIARCQWPGIQLQGRKSQGSVASPSGECADPVPSASVGTPECHLLRPRADSRQGGPSDAPTSAGVATRRLAHVPAECGAESTRRAVADAFGDFGDPKFLASEQILRRRQVARRAGFPFAVPAHGARETLEERRARQRGFLRELLHRPRTRGIAMHLPARRLRKPRIGQPAQQPRRRAFTWRRPQRFDQQHLH